MPSPFPGMDPYLENAEFFGGLHDSLITYLREALQNNLPEPYFADIRARVWIETSQRAIVPDVDVIRERGPSAPTASGVVTVAVPPVAVPIIDEEMSESFLEIHTVKGDHPLITAIEILSPTNKTSGVNAHAQYLQKQVELLKSRVNLVEIDLLRDGQPTTAVTYKNAVAAAGPFDYHVCVRRMDDLQRLHVYPISLKKALPEILIPLLPGDPDVKLDLQAVFNRAYDTGPYRRSSPYRVTPEPPLNPEQAAWAEALLREKGLLSGK